jgi:hypothetical protein
MITASGLSPPGIVVLSRALQPHLVALFAAATVGTCTALTLGFA